MCLCNSYLLSAVWSHFLGCTREGGSGGQRCHTLEEHAIEGELQNKWNFPRWERGRRGFPLVAHGEGLGCHWGVEGVWKGRPDPNGKAPAGRLPDRALVKDGWALIRLKQQSVVSVVLWKGHSGSGGERWGSWRRAGQGEGTSQEDFVIGQERGHQALID